MIYCPTVMARYSLFVLKVLLNPKQTNKQNLEPRSAEIVVLRLRTLPGVLVVVIVVMVVVCVEV